MTKSEQNILEIGVAGNKKEFSCFSSSLYKALKGCRENDLLWAPQLDIYIPAKNLHKLVLLERKDDPVFDIVITENLLRIKYTDNLGVSVRFSLKITTPREFRPYKKRAIIEVKFLFPESAESEPEAIPAPEPVKIESAKLPSPMVGKVRKQPRRKTAVTHPVLPYRSQYPVTGKMSDRILDWVDRCLYSVEMKTKGANT